MQSSSAEVQEVLVVGAMVMTKRHIHTSQRSPWNTKVLRSTPCCAFIFGREPKKRYCFCISVAAVLWGGAYLFSGALVAEDSPWSGSEVTIVQDRRLPWIVATQC